MSVDAIIWIVIICSFLYAYWPSKPAPSRRAGKESKKPKHAHEKNPKEQTEVQ